MRTYEITRGNDLTRTLYVHNDGKVVEETPGHDFPEGYLPNSKTIGNIERRIKPGTKSSRQYRALPTGAKYPGLWHSSVQRTVEDLEYLTRKQYLAETRCEIPAPLDVDHEVIVTPEALATTDEPEELLDAVSLVNSHRKYERDTFRFNGTMYLIANVNPRLAEVTVADDTYQHGMPTIKLYSVPSTAEAIEAAQLTRQHLDEWHDC